MTPIFVDANIPMYSYGGAHPYREPCRAALTRIAGEAGIAATSVEVLQELLHRYLSIGRPDVARQVTMRFMTLVPDVLPVVKDDVLKAVELSLQYPLLPCRDLIHVAVMLRCGLSEILSVDSHFDAISHVRRIDPASFAGSP